ncbi:MAG TPA: TRAP transporter TatT component family protein [Thermoanaerobaculaceae bacterium]|nr:TRAP transporter TatT component family protein [Thermoanaerobaculaceae bacterium]
MTDFITGVRCPAALAAVALSAVLAACSVRTMAVNALGNELAEAGSSWARDDDPELVRDATPFALKTIESLLEQSPRHRGLLLAAASGFTEYSYAFVQCEADYVETRDLAAATAMRARAGKLYRRALEYGLRGLEVGHPGLRESLRRDPDRAVLAMRSKGEVPLLYWTATAWGAAIAVAKEDPELAAGLPATEALVRRALALDEGFGAGALYDFQIAYDGGRPASSGGSVERARADLTSSLALAAGRRAAPLVTFAETVSVASQDRGEFKRLLAEALAVDVERAPEFRLANLVAQRRARWLLARADELFIE